jgi:deoxyribodipyrimidine photo-lyase
MTPTRSAALGRLSAFVPAAGRRYESQRNHDTGPDHPRTNVSGLSPYLRHRLITEAEVVAAVLQQHTANAAEKFIQEVCWRTYWKGWLELRPAVWRHYLDDLARLHNQCDGDAALADGLAAATTGQTGIACMDSWSRELIETGYLHNHTRMWFASVWIYTLRLPWQLGADFFMRYLLDGDPASNTLSWRWVCGLQTPGKTYLARAKNIEEFTGGRFSPYGELAAEAPPLEDSVLLPKPARLRPADRHIVGERTLLVLTEEDLHPESWGVPSGDVAAVVGLRTAQCDLGISTRVLNFKTAALADAVARAQAGFDCPVLVLPADLADCAGELRLAALKAKAICLTTMHIPIGANHDHLHRILEAASGNGLATRTLRRDWDSAFWPHATQGFFKLKEAIPLVVGELGLERQPGLKLV